MERIGRALPDLEHQVGCYIWHCDEALERLDSSQTTLSNSFNGELPEPISEHFKRCSQRLEGTREQLKQLSDHLAQLRPECEVFHHALIELLGGIVASGDVLFDSFCAVAPASLKRRATSISHLVAHGHEGRVQRAYAGDLLAHIDLALVEQQASEQGFAQMCETVRLAKRFPQLTAVFDQYFRGDGELDATTDAIARLEPRESEELSELLSVRDNVRHYFATHLQDLLP